MVENLNRYSHFAPRMEWVRQFFELQDQFFTRNNLGSVMLRFFKRFLLDADLIDKSGAPTRTTAIITRLGLTSSTGWAVILVNLSYGSPLIRWFLSRVIFDESYSRFCLLKMVNDYGSKGGPDAVNALGQFCRLPLCNVGFGKSLYNNRKLISITRHKWDNPSDLVILYSLYKFAEVSGWNYGFKLEQLFNNDISEEGVSPVKVFGINKKTLINILNGLSVNYPTFISAAFTLNLESVNLNPAKTSMDVLELFNPSIN